MPRHVGTAQPATRNSNSPKDLRTSIREEIREEESPQAALFSVKEVTDLWQQVRRAEPAVEPLGVDLADPGRRVESPSAFGMPSVPSPPRRAGDRLWGARGQSATRLIKELVLARIA